MPNTSPAADNPATIAWINERARQKACVNVFPTGAITKGLAGRGTRPHRRDGAGGRRGDHRRRPLRPEPRTHAPRGRIRADVRSARARPLSGLQPCWRRRDARRAIGAPYGDCPAGRRRARNQAREQHPARGVVRLSDPLPAPQLRGERAHTCALARARGGAHTRKVCAHITSPSRTRRYAASTPIPR